VAADADIAKCQLDRACTYAYNVTFHVTHFFDSMNEFHGPAAIRWAALF